MQVIGSIKSRLSRKAVNSTCLKIHESIHYLLQFEDFPHKVGDLVSLPNINSTSLLACVVEMSEPYHAAGEEVWQRQADLRTLRREGDELNEQQQIQYARLLEETEADRRLCNAAFAAGFIDHHIEMTLIQKEVADDIRLQSERVGVPWRGLAVEELIEVLRETAEERRDDLRKLLTYTSSMQHRAEELSSTAQRRVAILDDARDETIQEIQKTFAVFMRSLREREECLVRIAFEVARRRNEMLTAGLGALSEVMDLSETLLDRGNKISTRDDLHLLAELYEQRGDLDHIATRIDSVLSRVKREQAEDEALGAASGDKSESKSSGGDMKTEKLQVNSGEGKCSDEEKQSPEDKFSQFKAPKIEFRYDEWMHQRIATFGTVGSLESIKPFDFSSRPLRWDKNRSDTHLLELSESEICATHIGEQDAKASMFGSDGYADGTIVMRIEFSGLQSRQWVSAGVATAAHLNDTAFVRDTVIFEVSDTTDKAICQQTIDNKNIVTIVLDSSLRTIEYYKGGIRLKLVVLEQLPGDVDGHYFFPFCTLFHPGQQARLLSK